MKNIKIWLGMLAMVLVLGMIFVGCDGDGGGGSGGGGGGGQDPLTGTVSIKNDVTFSVGTETMTLTADVSELNGNSLYHFYQWKRENVNISGAIKSTYDVTSDDYGKKISVHVTNSTLSGEKSGEFTVPAPTTLNLTLKWNTSAGKKDTGITIERENGSYWRATSGNLTTTGTTIVLASWTETKFKMRTTYTMIESKFFFKKDNAQGSELFELTNGDKSFELTNTADSFGSLTGLFATEK